MITYILRPSCFREIWAPCVSWITYTYGEYRMYQFIPLHSCDYLKKISIKTNVATDEGKAKMKSEPEQMMTMGWLYKVGSECGLNSWPDGSIS